MKLLVILLMLFLSIMVSGQAQFQSKILSQELQFDDIVQFAYNTTSQRVLLSSTSEFSVYDLAFQELGNADFFEPFGPINLFSVNWSPDGMYLVILINANVDPSTQQKPSFLQIWNMTTFQMQMEIPLNFNAVPLAWKPDSTQFAVVMSEANTDSFVRIYDVQTGEPLQQFNYKAGRIIWGDYLVIGAAYDGVFVVNPQTGEILRTFDDFIAEDTATAISPSDDWLAFTKYEGSKSNLIHIVNIVTGQELEPLALTSEYLNSLQWVSEGLISIDMEGIVQLWNVETGESELLDFGSDAYVYIDRDLTHVLHFAPNFNFSIRNGRTGDIISSYPNPPLITSTSNPTCDPQAQETIPPQPQLIMDSVIPINLSWAAQQDILVFSDASLPSGGVINEFNTWYQFELDSNELLQSNLWPLQPPIPQEIEEQVLYGALLFRSPTERYYVFVSIDSDSESLVPKEIKVYDSLQNIVLNTGIPAGGSTQAVGFLDVMWGTDNAFVLKSLPEQGGLSAFPILHHVTIENNTAISRLLTGVDVNGRFLIIGNMFDVSSDGSYALIFAGLSGELQPSLAVWNLRPPYNFIFVPEAQIEPRTLLEARFTTEDGSEFVFVDDQRLGRYDVISGTSSTISTSVNGQNYRFAEFSNSGEMLALADDEAVYWLDLRTAQVASDLCP